MNRFNFALWVTCALSLVSGSVLAAKSVPAQEKIAATWERNVSNFEYKFAKSKRKFINSFTHKYYVTTNKKTGKTTVRKSRRPFTLNPNSKKEAVTLVNVGNGMAQQIPLPVGAATAIKATEMANSLWNGTYGRDKDGNNARVPSTPNMGVLPYLGKGVNVVLVRAGSYEKNIAPKYIVTGLKPNSKGVAGLRVRLLLPSSSHDGGTVEGGRVNAIKYAKIDKAAIWQTNPESSGNTKERIKTLADAIPFEGQLVTAVDLALPLKKGKLFQMQWDPMPGMTAGPGGFYAGRTIEFEWVGEKELRKYVEK